MEKATFTRQEVAQYLGVSTRTINTMMKEGKIPHIKLGGSKSSRVVFPKTEVDNWMAQRTAMSLHPAGNNVPDVVRRRPRIVN